MSTSVVDPKLKNLADEIEKALAGGDGGKAKSGYLSGVAAPAYGATTVAASLLSAYHSAALTNPTKAVKAKGLPPQIEVRDPSVVADSKFWDTLWDVVQVVGPVVVNALSKDYQPASKNLNSIIQSVPEHRRNDKDWVDFATTLLLNLAQGTVQAISGTKDFTDPATRPPVPKPPPGADKDFFSDAWDFVQDAAPVAMPIILSLL